MPPKPAFRFVIARDQQAVGMGDVRLERLGNLRHAAVQQQSLQAALQRVPRRDQEVAPPLPVMVYAAVRHPGGVDRRDPAIHADSGLERLDQRPAQLARQQVGQHQDGRGQRYVPRLLPRKLVEAIEARRHNGRRLPWDQSVCHAQVAVGHQHHRRTRPDAAASKEADAAVDQPYRRGIGGIAGETTHHVLGA